MYEVINPLASTIVSVSQLTDISEGDIRFTSNLEGGIGGTVDLGFSKEILKLHYTSFFGKHYIHQWLTYSTSIVSSHRNIVRSPFLCKGQFTLLRLHIC